MASRLSDLVVIGPAGSGRTHALDEWAEAARRDVDGPVVRISGFRGARPHVDGDPHGAAALVVDDADACPADLLDSLADVVAPTALARSVGPTGPHVDRLEALLDRRGAERVVLGARSGADIRALVTDLSADGATPTEEQVAEVERWTLGLPGLVADLLAGGVVPDVGTDDRDGDGGGPAPDAAPTVSLAVTDAVGRRLRRTPPDVVAVLELMALGAGRDHALSTVERRTAVDGAAGPAEAPLADRLGASGMVVGDAIVPVVATVLRATLGPDRTAAGAAALLAGEHPAPADRRAEWRLLAGERVESDRAELALAALRVAPAVALGHLTDAAAVGADPLLLARARFGLAARDDRWGELVAVDAEDRLDPELRRLAELLAGNPPDADASTSEVAEPAPTGDGSEIDVVRRLAELLRVVGHDHHDLVATLASRVVDDAVALDGDLPPGASPALVAGACLLLAGDATAARLVLADAMAAGLAGPAATVGHRLLDAYAGVLLGEYSPALDLVRRGEQAGWSRRDRLLHAALDAAIGRRSGDIARLRDAWTRAERSMLDPDVSWIWLDPMVEILAAGVRVGDERRVRPAVHALASRLEGVGEFGSAGRVWLDLQLAVAGEQLAGVAGLVDVGASRPATDGGGSRRTRAIAAAGVAWRLIAEGDADVAEVAASVDVAVDRLVEVDQPWEASRLLGQAALDHPDPGVARTLLERARSLVTDVRPTTDSLVAAGLSEREADVARAVAAGRTYKEIGAQLFISAKTVEHHVARIRQRLGASSRAELIAIVQEHS